jgi:SAM-dependent methyltransferase
MSERGNRTTIEQHYDELLGPIYVWMMGGREAATERSRKTFRELGLEKVESALAVDLGCGAGFQSVPLAELGYEVVGIDGCEQLLADLDAHPGSSSIRTVHGDLLAFRGHVQQPADLIVCMGDTLPHLPSFESVEQLCSDIAAALAPGGRLVLSFRDNATAELEGASRFIPVRSDDNTIMTCFLEFHAKKIRVHDLVYRRASGGWTFDVGVYEKLRLPPEWIVRQLQANGLQIMRHDSTGGMVTIMANRTS